MPRRLSSSALTTTRRSNSRKKILRELLGAVRENGEPDWERRLAAAAELTELVLQGQQEVLRRRRTSARAHIAGAENAPGAPGSCVAFSAATPEAQGGLAACGDVRAKRAWDQASAANAT